MTDERRGRPSPPRRFARVLVPILLFAAGALALCGVVGVYVQREIVDSGRFADRTVGAFGAPAVRRVVSARIADRVVGANGDLVAVRPLIDTAAHAVIGTPAFRSLLRAGVYNLHAAALDRDRTRVALVVADAGVLVVDGLRRLSPRVARQVPDFAEVQATTLGRYGGTTTRALRAAERLASLRWLAFALAGLCAAAAAALARGRRRALAGVALAVAGAGAVGALALTVARAVVLSKVSAGPARAAVSAAWDAFLGTLRTWTLVGLAIGILVAAAAAALEPAGDARALLGRARRLAFPAPDRVGARALRALGLVALGVIVVAERELALQVIVAAAGLAIAWVGVGELARLAASAEVRRPKLHALRGGGALRFASVRPGRWLGAAGLAAAVAVVAVVVVRSTGTGAAEAPSSTGERCNGHAALCGRRLDQVSFPATHNAMSAASQPGWLFAQQEVGIGAQLRDGIRGLLIDTIYGVPTRRGVYTVLSPKSSKLARLEDPVSTALVRTAERLRQRLGYRGGGPRGLFLCHAFCEVGAARAQADLEAVRDFVVVHPDEVVVLSIQDAVSPQDTEELFRRSGLLPLVYQGPSGPPWPTLGELIERGQRVVVFGENDTGGIPWYRPQFKLMQETPYHFTSVAALEAPTSCAPNRGPRGAPLFLLNHWVDTSPAPRPSNARKVNARAFLLDRARRCQRARRRLPNLVAVDFFREGDLFGVVDTLNGVAGRGWARGAATLKRGRARARARPPGRRAPGRSARCPRTRGR